MTPEDEKKKRYAILWDTIERLAFIPQKPDNWLSLYEKTLSDLWGLQRGDIRMIRHSKFEVDFLNITCNYNIEDTWKYSGIISNMENDSQAIWALEVDPIHISKSNLHNSTAKYSSQNKLKHLRNDIEAVLNGMLFHPCHHCHIDKLGVVARLQGSKTTKNGVHDVRIGGGISNAFVFLFHLRYQFCIISDQIREQERNRLINLFTNAIKKDLQSIPTNNLFNFKK